ncbi:AraC-like ligand-binding domain-containing protein [Duganella hordei]|uniref:AraC-like ligand-binding domain-containing protein n=1 Tax=Duganella hordei TaxID=2865934 RepID=UPI0030E9A1F4
MSTFFSTEMVPIEQRASYWRDVVGKAFVPLSCDIGTPGNFRGSIKQSTLANLHVAELRCDAHNARRTSQHISGQIEECFLVAFQTSGQGMFEQDGRVAVVGPGDFVLCGSSRPYELNFYDDFRQTVLVLPASQMRTHLPDADALTAIAVGAGHGSGQLIDSVVRTLGAAETFGPAAGAMADAVLNIIVAGLRTLPAARASGPSDLTRFHIDRARQHAMAQLHDPALNAAAIAHAVGLSTAHLHRLFQREPQSLMQWVWTERLEVCKHNLSAPAMQGRSVSSIAFAAGFNSAPHFSRLFRQRYGLSPSAWRSSLWT